MGTAGGAGTIANRRQHMFAFGARDIASRKEARHRRCEAAINLNETARPHLDEVAHQGRGWLAAQISKSPVNLQGQPLVVARQHELASCSDTAYLDQRKTRQHGDITLAVEQRHIAPFGCCGIRQHQKDLVRFVGKFGGTIDCLFAIANHRHGFARQRGDVVGIAVTQASHQMSARHIIEMPGRGTRRNNPKVP